MLRKFFGSILLILSLYSITVAVTSINEPFMGGPMSVTSISYLWPLLPIGALVYLAGLYLLKFDTLINIFGLIVSGIHIMTQWWEHVQTLNTDYHYRTGSLAYNPIYFNDPSDSDLVLIIAILFILSGAFIFFRNRIELTTRLKSIKNYNLKFIAVWILMQTTIIGLVSLTDYFGSKASYKVSNSLIIISFLWALFIWVFEIKNFWKLYPRWLVIFISLSLLIMISLWHLMLYVFSAFAFIKIPVGQN